MAYIHKNILGSVGLTQLIHSKNSQNVLELVITNVHNTSNCTIDLLLRGNPTPTTASKYYILKNVIIAKGTALVLDNADIGYDSKVYDLYLTLHRVQDKVDLKLKTE